MSGPLRLTRVACGVLRDPERKTGYGLGTMSPDQHSNCSLMQQVTKDFLVFCQRRNLNVSRSLITKCSSIRVTFNSMTSDPNFLRGPDILWGYFLTPSPSVETIQWSWGSGLPNQFLIQIRFRYNACLDEKLKMNRNHLWILDSLFLLKPPQLSGAIPIVWSVFMKSLVN